MKNSLFDNAKTIYHDAEYYEKQAFSFIRMYFEAVDNNQSKIILDGLRKQIEKSEFLLRKTQ